MKIVPILLTVLISLGIAGCSTPVVKTQKSIYSYTREEKPVKSGLAARKKVVFIKDFRENESYDEYIEDFQKVIEKYILEHPELSESIKDNLRKMEVKEGSTKEEVHFLLGKPDKIMEASKGAPNDASEIWIYRISKLRAFTIFIIPVFLVHEGYYLYFKDGKIVQIERHSLQQVVGQAPGPGLGMSGKK